MTILEVTNRQRNRVLLRIAQIRRFSGENLQNRRRMLFNHIRKLAYGNLLQKDGQTDEMRR